MLQQYIEQHKAISTALCLLDRNDLVISTDKNSFMRHYISALQLFETVTCEISSEKYVSLSLIIPLSKALLQFLSSQTTSNRQLNEKLSSEMSVKFRDIEDNHSILDLRFKKLPFADTAAVENHRSQLVAEVSSQKVPVSQPLQPVSDTTSAECDSIWQFFNKQVAACSTRQLPL